MTTVRTRIARLAAASAVVVSLGALTAGPAAAQTGTDIGSSKPRLAQTGGDIGSAKPRLAQTACAIGWCGASVGFKSFAATFGDDASPAFTLAATDVGSRGVDPDGVDRGSGISAAGEDASPDFTWAAVDPAPEVWTSPNGSIDTI